MKPSNWDELSGTVKTVLAEELLNSPRGHYLIGQALYNAVQLMKQVPLPQREVSNIEDMEMIATLFQAGWVMAQLQEQTQKQMEEIKKDVLRRATDPAATDPTALPPRALTRSKRKKQEVTEHGATVPTKKPRGRRGGRRPKKQQ